MEGSIDLVSLVTHASIFVKIIMGILLFASLLILFWIFCFPVCLRALAVSHTDAVPYTSWSPFSLFNVICDVVDNIVVCMHACILVGKPNMMKMCYCVFMFVYIL